MCINFSIVSISPALYLVYGNARHYSQYASAVTSSEKSSINTNRKSTARFSNEPKMNIVRCPSPKGGLSATADLVDKIDA